MKINVSPDGTVSFDISTNTSAEVVEIIEQLRNSKTGIRQLPDISQKVQRTQPTTQKNGVELNSLQYETWEFLVDNDCSDGVHISAVARGFGIPHDAAGCRLRRLTDKGYAIRVAQGYYRAVEGRKP